MIHFLADAVAATQPSNQTEDSLNLASISGIIAVTFIIVEVAKNLIKPTTKILGSVPVIFFPLIIAPTLAFFANKVMKLDDGSPILSGNIWIVLGRAILGAASSSGLYTWIHQPGTTVGEAKPLIGDMTMKPNYMLMIVGFSLILTGCSNVNPEKVALREAMYGGTQQIRENEATWAQKLVAYPVGTTDPRTGQASDGKNRASEIPPLTPAQYKNDVSAHAEFESLVSEDRARDSKGGQ